MSIIQSRWGEEERWLLDTGEVTGRAFSCLVCPEPGDKVVVLKSGGRPSILSILARPRDVTTRSNLSGPDLGPDVPDAAVPGSHCTGRGDSR